MAPRNFWIARARRLRARRNLACYLEAFLPVVLFVCGTGAAALLLVRTWGTNPEPVWWCFAAAMVATLAVSWFRARRSFLRADEALVRLEEVGKLHNRLTAARAGVGEWPGPREVREPVRWSWQRLLTPVALSLVLLLGAAWLPVPRLAERAVVTEQPLAWAQVETWLQTLEEAQLVEEQALDQVREQLDGIREQPPNEWYNQSSLEAGDTLREQTEQSLRAMLQHLEKAEQALEAMSNASEQATPQQLQAMNASLQEALRGLELGTLPLKQEQLAELKNLDASQLKQLSAAQLKEMRERLQKGARVAEQCVRPGAGARGALVAEAPGGGPGGGGGPAPLTLKEQPTDLATKTMETLSNDDASQALPADLLGVQKGEHEVNTTQEPQQIAGGAIRSTGEGGEAVRRDSLTPRERQQLQRFFK